MSQTNSSTFTPSRQRGQHLKFEDRCSLKIFKKLNFSLRHMVCTKTLYNELQDGNLPLTLFDVPEALGRSKKKRMKVRQHKRISGKSIDERPATIAERTECGHWEIDTVVGRRGGKESVVLTIVEKQTDYYIALKIPGKDAVSVMTALEVLREEYIEEHFSKVFKTITADNGPQFERLSEQLLKFADEMNALPRKQLDYATPEELFDSFLDAVYSNAENSVT